MSKYAKSNIRNTTKVTSIHTKVTWRSAKGGTAIERKNHGSSADFLFGSFLNLPWRPASIKSLVGSGAARGDRHGSNHQFSCVAKPSPLVEGNPDFP